MNLLVKEKDFYRSMIAIALPIALQNMIGFGVQLMDTIMVGALGDTSLSAASLANQPFFVFMLFNFGLASGAGVLIAQYWGKGNVDAVRRLMGIPLRFVAVVAVVLTLICNLFPTQIMDLFSNEPAVIAEAARYLRVVSLSYLFYGISCSYLMSLRAVENVRFSTFVYLVSFFVNIFFNWVFIFGKLGAPALGIVGAAIGTVIARISEFALILLYMYRFEKKVGFTLKTVFSGERELFPDYIRHALPVVGSELIWGLGTVTQTAIIGNIGATFVAANSIAGVIQQLATVMLFGIGNAAAIMVGKSVGSGDTDRTKRIATTMLVLSVSVGAVSCGIMLLLRRPFLQLYDVTPQTAELAYQIIGVMAALIVGAAIEITCIIGILRGAGDTRYAFAVDVGCSWLIAVPMGYLAGFVWHLPVLLVYVCLRSDLVVRLILCVTRIARGRYIRNVTRELEPFG